MAAQQYRSDSAPPRRSYYYDYDDDGDHYPNTNKNHTRNYTNYDRDYTNYAAYDRNYNNPPNANRTSTTRPAQTQQAQPAYDPAPDKYDRPLTRYNPRRSDQDLALYAPRRVPDPYYSDNNDYRYGSQPQLRGRGGGRGRGYDDDYSDSSDDDDVRDRSRPRRRRSRSRHSSGKDKNKNRGKDRDKKKDRNNNPDPNNNNSTFWTRTFDASHDGIGAAVAGALIGGMTAKRFLGEENRGAKVVGAALVTGAAFNAAENYLREEFGGEEGRAGKERGNKRGRGRRMEW